jgi:hypothetical protein
MTTLRNPDGGKTLKKSLINNFYDLKPARRIQLQFLINSKTIKTFNEVDASVGCEVGLSGAVARQDCTREFATVDDTFPHQPEMSQISSNLLPPLRSLFDTH